MFFNAIFPKLIYITEIFMGNLAVRERQSVILFKNENIIQFSKYYHF